MYPGRHAAVHQRCLEGPSRRSAWIARRPSCLVTTQETSAETARLRVLGRGSTWASPGDSERTTMGPYQCSTWSTKSVYSWCLETHPGDRWWCRPARGCTVQLHDSPPHAAEPRLPPLSRLQRYPLNRPNNKKRNLSPSSTF